MTTLSKLSFQEEGHGLSKMNKRHAQESMMKKRVGHMKVQVFKENKKRERDSPCPKKEKWREIAHERSSYIIHTKIHTHAHLDQGL